MGKWSSLCSKEVLSLLKDSIGNLGAVSEGLGRKEKLPRLVLRKQSKSVSIMCLRERPLWTPTRMNTASVLAPIRRK